MNLKNSILDQIRTMKDGSLKITLVTRELPTEDLAQLFTSINQEIVSVDIPEDVSDQKTPSQRLRWVLFKVWEQSHKEDFKTFTMFYNHILEQLINMYKDKLS